jgi:hypothetical protein
MLQTGNNVRRFGPKRVHHFDNVIQIETEVHHRVHSVYENPDVGLTGSPTMRVREWVQTKSFEYQHQFGINVLRGAYGEFTE